MNQNKPHRDVNVPIIWEGDLNDDCTARWAGLMLRAEEMDDNRWWWCVYDMQNDEIEIDSSNNYHFELKHGKSARHQAEKVAREYLKNLT